MGDRAKTPERPISQATRPARSQGPGSPDLIDHPIFESISKEIHAIDSDIVEVSYGRILKSNFNSIDTIPTFYVQWKEDAQDVELKNDKIQNWLRVKTENQKLRVEAVK